MHKFFYILGAGKPFRGSKPSALHNIEKKTLIDFFIEVAELINFKTICVTGFKDKYFETKNPSVKFLKNKIWEKTKSGYSFLSNIQDYNSQCIITYSDIIFDKSVVKTLYSIKSDIVIAVDGMWKYRYSQRSISDIRRSEKVFFDKNNLLKISQNIISNKSIGEFVGLVKLSKRSMIKLKKINENISNKVKYNLSLADVINILTNEGLRVNFIDLHRGWAELNHSYDLSQFILSTKANTLSRLENLITKSKILNQLSFTYGNWKENENKFVKKIVNKFYPNEVIVRSSSINEDNFSQSNAGLFLTESNITTKNKTKLIKSIKNVFNSYNSKKLTEQILIQPMLKNILASGVIMTRSKDIGAPYYEVNIDDKSGKTDTITSGKTSDISTFFISRNINKKKINKNFYIDKLISAIQEIEKILKYDSLDIEFAFTKKFDLYILQVRPMLIKTKDWGNQDNKIFNQIAKSERLFTKYSRKNDKVFGKKNILGVMPDWNPAEILGIKPNKLAISLYQYLILDGNWAKQRFQYGYKKLGSYKLLKNISGHPYIDVRASLNSFLPLGLNKKISEKIINFSINYLENNPYLHDKVEFELFPTSFDFNYNKWKNHFVNNKVLTNSEFQNWQNLLTKLTIKGIERTENDYNKIFKLVENSRLILETPQEPLTKAFLLLDDAKRGLVLNFAHLARSAFISISILNSLVQRRIINQEEMNDFLNSIKTISSKFLIDAYDCAHKKLTRRKFIDEYGHLRPETYNIISNSYANEPKLYIEPVLSSISKNKFNNDKYEYGKLWTKAKSKVGEAFKVNNFKFDANQIENFFRFSIKGRELAKFYFTKNVSYALEEIKKWGISNDFSPKDLSNFKLNEIRRFKKLNLSDPDLKAFFFLKKKRSFKERKVIEALIFPPLIFNENNFSFFEYPATLPNYIGNKVITGKTHFINKSFSGKSLRGKIILIPNADPGYDWIFSQNILGFVTMFGGTNSHMSIRASEFRMTAVIGTGKVLFDSLITARVVEIDPINHNLRVLN